MPAPARFLFDTDFAAPPPRPEPAPPPVPTIELSVHEALLADAERRGFERGHVEGREAGEVKAAGRLAEEAARLAAAAQSILAVLDGERARMELEAMRLAELVGRKLAGRLWELHPHEALLSVVSEALAPLRTAPHLVIRIAAEDVSQLTEALETIARERCFEGRLVVLGEPSIARGDCRVEWADGGIVLDRAATAAAVARALERHIAPLAAAAAASDPGA